MKTLCLLCLLLVPVQTFAQSYEREFDDYNEDRYTDVRPNAVHYKKSLARNKANMAKIKAEEGGGNGDVYVEGNGQGGVNIASPVITDNAKVKDVIIINNMKGNVVSIGK